MNREWLESRKVDGSNGKFFFGLFSLSVPFPWVNHGDGLTRQNQGVSDTLAGRRGILQHRVQNQWVGGRCSRGPSRVGSGPSG